MLLVAAALAAVGGARAQDAGLRIGDKAGGGLPGATTDAPTLVPDRNAPPSITAAPSDADDTPVPLTPTTL